MKRSSILDLIQVSEHSPTPKYLQLTKSILRALDAGKIEKGDLLPSINELSFELDISRRTAEKGYAYLKHIGVLGSVPGKAFFIKRPEFRRNMRIILLFNKLSVYKKMVYDSFVNSLGENASIDLYIYNNHYPLFEKLLLEKKEEYNYYVIIPFFQNGGQDGGAVLNQIPRDRLILLGRKPEGLDNGHAAVFEDFGQDIYGALCSAGDRLRKYDGIKIIFPRCSCYPDDILKGLEGFCQDFHFHYEVISQIAQHRIRRGSVYISITDDDLVLLIEQVKSSGLLIGRDVGIISYNETSLKRIILNGITTISTDFYEMGKMAARLILNRSQEQVHIPFRLTLRDSL